jgi:hypothetical protein
MKVSSNFMPRPCYLRESAPRYQMNIVLSEPQSRSARSGGSEKNLTIPRVEPRPYIWYPRRYTDWTIVAHWNPKDAATGPSKPTAKPSTILIQAVSLISYLGSLIWELSNWSELMGFWTLSIVRNSKFQWLRLCLSKGPNRVSLLPHLKTETDPVFLLFRIPDDEQSPETQ